MENIMEQNGKKYIIIGDKAMEINSFDEAGKPVIKVESEKIVYPDGRQDVIIRVPCLSIQGENKI